MFRYSGTKYSRKVTAVETAPGTDEIMTERESQDIASRGTAPYLALHHLSKEFPLSKHRRIKAVDKVSFSINKGEFVTLIGPSGCGKSTTLRMIAGFTRPTEGEIIQEGRPITHLGPDERNIPMVFQNYALFPHMNVFENIAYGLKSRNYSSEAIMHDVAMICQMLNLVGTETRFPNELSDGQQQRVALARALILKPKILLFDEPLSNLDARLRIQTRAEIKRMQQILGITMIYVTHDQEEALSMADRIVIMSDGEIQQVGTPWEIYRKPASSFVAGFVGTSNFIEGRKNGSGVKINGQVFKINGLEKIKPEKVCTAIRPEKIEMVSDLTDMEQVEKDNIVEATVDIITFLGAVVQITFIMDGVEMNVDITEGEFERLRLRQGDKIKLHFPPDSFHLYEEKPAGI